MPKPETVAWMDSKLASRKGYKLPPVPLRQHFSNEVEVEKVLYQAPSQPSVLETVNDTDETIEPGWQVPVTVEDEVRMGVVTAPAPPGKPLQVAYEAGRRIKPGEEVILAPDKVGQAEVEIHPGQVGPVRVEMPKVLGVGQSVTLANGRVGTVVADIQPGETGEVEYSVQNEQPTNPNVIVGAIDIKEDGTRIWADFPPEGLAEVLEAGLPSILPEGNLSETEFNDLIAHATGLDGEAAGWLVRSLRLWRTNGLI